jgi:hypothetical protein
MQVETARQRSEYRSSCLQALEWHDTESFRDRWRDAPGCRYQSGFLTSQMAARVACHGSDESPRHLSDQQAVLIGRWSRSNLPGSDSSAAGDAGTRPYNFSLEQRLPQPCHGIPEIS